MKVPFFLAMGPGDFRAEDDIVRSLIASSSRAGQRRPLLAQSLLDCPKLAGIAVVRFVADIPYTSQPADS